MTLDVGRAIELSLTVGVLASLVGLVPAGALGWLLARKEFRGKALLTSLAMVPLVLPPVVTGLLLLHLFGRASPVGAAMAAVGWPVPFTQTGAVLAAVVVGFPLYVLTIRTAIEAVDVRYEDVSASLGVPPARTFWRVTAPLALPGLAAGVVLAFARGLGEFGATAVIAGNMEGRTRTIALAVYSLLDAPQDDPRVVTLVMASLVLAMGSLVAWEGLNRWQRRRLELDV